MATARQQVIMQGERAIAVAPANAVRVTGAPGDTAGWLGSVGGRLTEGPVQVPAGVEAGAPAGQYLRRERPVVEQGQS